MNVQSCTVKSCVVGIDGQRVRIVERGGDDVLQGRRLLDCRDLVDGIGGEVKLVEDDIFYELDGRSVCLSQRLTR